MLYIQGNEVMHMYGGSSGCFGMVIYDTKLEGSNAVYGYYKNDEMRFETGTLEEMKAFKKEQEKELAGKGKGDLKIMGISLLVYIVAAVLGFAVMPLRVAVSILLFAFLAYAPSMVIALANTGMYEDENLRTSFRRFHGCEHSIITLLTKEKDCSAESIKNGRIYDPECGTAYSGYVIFLALVLAVLIAVGTGFFRILGLMLLAVVIVFVMILVPKINPFTLFQRPVVLRPTDRECALGVEIIARLKEL